MPSLRVASLGPPSQGVTPRHRCALSGGTALQNVGVEVPLLSCLAHRPRTCSASSAHFFLRALFLGADLSQAAGFLKKFRFPPGVSPRLGSRWAGGRVFQKKRTRLRPCAKFGGKSKWNWEGRFRNLIVNQHA